MEQPTTIGRYEIVNEIGRGGMATVYRAFDPLVKRDVAIKLLPREFMHNTDFRARFEQEARIIATLEHPAIVPIYDFGEDGDQPYIVMRLLTGGTLSDRIAHGPMPLVEVSRIISAIAPGLDQAHSQGIIHRDIKPANVLFDGFNNPHLSDFGLVKMVNPGGGSAPDSGMFGTPEYMAPEMASRGQITYLIDIYALGVAIWEMLTGKPPFSADTPVGLLMAHATQALPDLHEMLPDLPDVVQDVLAVAMAKAPADRYQTAQELANDLEAISVTGKTQKLSTLRRDRTPQLDEAGIRRTQRGQSTRRILIGAGVVVVAALAVAGLALGGVIRANPGAPTQAVVAAAPTDTPASTQPPSQPASAAPSTVPPTKAQPTTQPTVNPHVITLATIRNVQPIKRLSGHTDIVNAVAWSANDLLASSSADKTVILWDINSGQPLATLTGHTSWVQGLAFSPDGKQLVSASSDHTAIVWDVASRQPVHTIQMPLGLNDVAWSPDGQRLAFSPYYVNPILYSVQTGQVIRELKGHDYQINAVAFSPDGQYLASGSSDASIRIWDAVTGDPIRVLTGHARTVLSVSWAPYTRELASGSEDRRVIIWDAETGEMELKLIGHTAQVTSTAWSPDGNIVASASADGTVRLWNADTGDQLRLLDPGSGPILKLAWSPDGQWIATAQSNGSVVLWGVP